MLKLENVAAEEVTLYVQNKELAELVYNSNISSVKDLIIAVDGDPKLHTKEFQKRLETVIKDVAKYNEKSNGKDTEHAIYNVLPYKDKSLEAFDRKNDISSLILMEPDLSNAMDYISIYHLNIHRLKRYLTLTTKDGRNYLESMFFGENSNLTRRLVSAINLYTEMMERLNEKYNGKHDFSNPIYKHYEIRKQLVTESYKDIVQYFIDHSSKSSFRWGTTNELTFLKPLVSNEKDSEIVYTVLVDYLAKYLTIDELEGIQNGTQRVLDRFINR